MNYKYTDYSFYLFKHEIINGKYDIFNVFTQIYLLPYPDKFNPRVNVFFTISNMG